MPGWFSDTLLFHHCIPVERVRHRTICRPDTRFSDPDFRPAYQWLEDQIGFAPFFFSVGCDLSAIRLTGYDDNWRVWKGSRVVRGKRQEILRRHGEFPNLALFSFEDIDGIFMDYGAWHIALNSCRGSRPVSTAEERMIFKPSWSRARWIRAARGTTHSIQLVAPELPLDRAARVSVRNTKTRDLLAATGFLNPVVLRIPVLRH